MLGKSFGQYSRY